MLLERVNDAITVAERQKREMAHAPRERCTPDDSSSSTEHATSTERDRSEFELKLAAPPAELKKAEQPLLTTPTVRSEIQSDLVSIYYDTPTLALYRKRLTLRVRKLGREFLQTVKAEDPTAVDFLERPEWEEPIASKRPDLNARKTGKWLADVVGVEDLRPIFTTKVKRRVIEIEPSPSAPIEAAIDMGEIRTATGGAVEPISELELELKSGDPAVLYDVALRLIQVAQVRIETRSKAERGYGIGPRSLRQAGLFA